MNDIKLLTVKELAERWRCSERCIHSWIQEGVLAPCKNVPGLKFHPKNIASMEGVEIEKFSPLERRRLLRKIEELEGLVALQSEQLRKVASLGTESMVLLQKII